MPAAYPNVWHLEARFRDNAVTRCPRSRCRPVATANFSVSVIPPSFRCRGRFASAWCADGEDRIRAADVSRRCATHRPDDGVGAGARPASRRIAGSARRDRAASSERPKPLGQCAAAVAAAESELGPLTILVNNAGVTVAKPVLQHTEEEWDYVLDTNLKGAWLMAREFAQHLVDRGRPGRIVNIASVLGLRTIWINRYGERREPRPSRELPDLSGVPGALDELVPA